MITTQPTNESQKMNTEITKPSDELIEKRHELANDWRLYGLDEFPGTKAHTEASEAFALLGEFDEQHPEVLAWNQQEDSARIKREHPCSTESCCRSGTYTPPTGLDWWVQRTTRS